MRIHQLLSSIVGEIEERVDRARHRPARQATRRRPIRIEPYLGYGTLERAWIHGRVVAHPAVRASRDADGRWRNLLHMYRRLMSAEIPGARVRVSYGSVREELVADEEGFYGGWLRSAPGGAGGPWRDVELELLAPLREGRSPARTTGKVLIPPRSATLGVISDVDDTVVETDATSMLRMARSVLFGSARTRLPFSGVSAFYRALRRGPDGDRWNPLFYVSSSPWNLFDLLIEFFELERIPAGPLILRDWGITRDELVPTRHAAHKHEAIERILTTYPALPFILVGDSGQEDPEIYRDIVHRHGARILAVYIRNVTGLERGQAIHDLSREVVAAGSSLVLADDTAAAARHAAEHGWIDPAWLPRIDAACSEDEAGDPGTPIAQGGRRREDTPTVTIAVERFDEQRV